MGVPAQIDVLAMRRALTVTRDLAAIRNLAEFSTRSAALLRELIPCDHAGYNAIDLVSGTATVVADPADVVFDGGPEALAQLGGQNPLVVRAQVGDMHAMRLSDHISRRAFHRTELYNEIYRRVGMEHQLVVQLPPLRREFGRPHEVNGFSLARSRADFTDADLGLLQLMRPVFAGTLLRLHELALVRAVAGGGHSGRLVLLVDHDDVVAWASDAARQALGVVVGGPLPPALRSWLVTERCRPRRTPPPRVTVHGRALRGRLMPDAYPGLDAVWLEAARQAPGVSDLLALGLSRRQTEVVALALDGLSTGRIARQLGLSPRTVEKHFEAVYATLGVHNRTQMIVTLLERAAP